MNWRNQENAWLKEVGIALVIKTLLLFLLWYAFFSEREHPDPGDIGHALFNLQATPPSVINNKEKVDGLRNRR